MGEFSLMHWLVVLGIGMLFFGPSRLPQLGQSLGKAIRGFKSGLKDVQDELNKGDESEGITERVVATPSLPKSQTETEKNS